MDHLPHIVQPKTRPGNGIDNISLPRLCIDGLSGEVVEIAKTYLKISFTASSQPKL